MSNLLKFVLFADDTNIFCSSASLHDLKDTINMELDTLFVWFSVNRLSLNLGKTNYMLFRSRPPDNELALKINNVVLPRVAATKFLGIIIDDKLSWKLHIQSVKSKLSSVLSIMYRASKDMSILKLSEFVKYKTDIVMFNIFHGTLPIQLQRRFTKYSSVYSTRQNKSFLMVQVRTNLNAMCLSVHGVNCGTLLLMTLRIVLV